MRRVLPALLTLALTLCAAVLPSTAARAHAELLSSSPAAGEELDVVPTSVVLTFSEDVRAELSQVRVSDGEGIAMTKGKPTADGATLTQGLQELHPGTYSITYKVTSADGHPISDSISFTISEAAMNHTTSSTASPTSEATSEATSSSSTTSSTTSATPVASPSAAGGDGPSADDGSGAGLPLVIGLGALVLGGLFIGLRRRGGPAQAGAKH